MIRFFLRNTTVINLVLALILIVGGMRMFTLRREAFPSVNFDIVIIQTSYPGASPREVEQYVTNPLEEELDKVSGIDEMSSVSIEGFSLITVKIDADLDRAEKDEVITDLQRAVDRTRDLPDELPDPPLVDAIDSEDMPVLQIALSGEPDYAALHRHGEALVDLLEEIPDVSTADWLGKRERELWVEVNPRALERYRIGLTQVVAALAARNINLPGGPIRTPGGELLVRTVAGLDTPDSIGAVVLRSNDAGVAVRIRDVARVTDTFEEARRVYRSDGREAVVLNVTMNGGEGDIINLVGRVKATVADYLAGGGAGSLRVTYANDMSFFVKRRLNVLIGNGVFGLALVAVILLLFLSVGMATVTAAGMPIAFFATMLYMSQADMTINLISMFGLILVLGMLVDDAIVVAENIWQHYEDGESPWDATVNGAREVIAPVTSTVLTTIVAFTPLLLISGIFGKIMAEMPKVVIICLTASLLEAFITLPPHAYELLMLREKVAAWRNRRAAARGAPTAPDAHAHRRSAIYDRLTDAYGAVLRLMLRGRYLVVVGVVAFLVFTLQFARANLPFVLFPSAGIEAFFVRVDQPIGTDLDTTAERLRAIEQVVLSLPDEELDTSISYVGVQQNDPNDPLTQRGSHLAQVLLFLTPVTERARSADAIIDDLRPRIAAAAAAAGFTKQGFERVRPGPPVGKPVAIRVSGDDYGRLAAASVRIEEHLAELPGVSDISSTFAIGKDEVRVAIDEHAAARALLNADQISTQILAAFEGLVATKVREDDEQVPIRVRFPEADRNRLQTLSALQLTNGAGQLIPLRQVARLDRQPGINQIIHRDGRRVVTIAASVDEQTTSSSRVNTAMLPVLAELGRDFPDLRFAAGGEFEDTQESLDSLGDAFVIALGLIFAILAAQFKSVTQPLVVMSAIPFGVIGVVWAFWLHGMPMSFLGMLGLIGLSGVVVNDSIVLVSFLNGAREQGMPALDAAVYAGKRRFRAVWLTTITTIAGVLPMVYGIGGTDEFLQPAAAALGYGLLFGTVLILFFVPSLYLVRVDIINVLRRLVRLEPLPMTAVKGGPASD